MDSSAANFKDKLKMFQGKSAGTSADPQQAGTPKTERHKFRSKQPDSELFKKPAELIFTDKETEKLRCNEKTLTLLHEINHPLNVVAITGLFRTGKSYLLNRLAGERSGFDTGDDVHACTKGIWIWCRHHPLDEDQVLVLLDVEGFGDMEKDISLEAILYDPDESKGRHVVFHTCDSLSSCLVYNNMGTLDAYALDRLNRRFLKDIDSMIQVSQREEDTKLLDFDFFFPYFIVTLRDFRLKIVNKSKKPITPDEYLEGLLEQNRGEGEDIETFNRIRLLIRRYFKKRKCFVFMQPCGPKAQLEKLSDKDLEPDFLNSVDEFSKYIFSREPLQMKSCRKINGRMFANLVRHYVNEIGQDKHPSILDATRYMVEVENQTYVAEASKVYKKQMQDYIAKMGDCTPSDETLVEFHEKCIAEALDYFKQVILFDDEDVFQRKAMSAFKNLLSQFKRICDENSKKNCNEAILRLNQKIERKLKNGAYSCESGYDEYIKDINWVTRTYTNLTGLGSKTRAILQAYLDGKEEEGELVYKLVLKAKTGEGDKQLSQLALQRRSSKLNDFAANISRYRSFGESLRVKVEKMEDKLQQELEDKCKDDKEKIKANYIDNLEMKLKELERQMSEIYGNRASMSEIKDQFAYFQKVLESAKSLKEGDEGSSEATNRLEEVKTEDKTDKTDLGERPVTMGGSQETVYTEKPNQPIKPPKPWCRIQ